MFPAGLMWSVVTESPKIPSGRAPVISVMSPGVMLNFEKNGGSWMYVESRSQSYTNPVDPVIPFHFGFCSAKPVYSFWKTSGESAERIAASIS